MLIVSQPIKNDTINPRKPHSEILGFCFVPRYNFRLVYSSYFVESLIIAIHLYEQPCPVHGLRDNDGLFDTAIIRLKTGMIKISTL